MNYMPIEESQADNNSSEIESLRTSLNTVYINVVNYHLLKYVASFVIIAFLSTLAKVLNFNLGTIHIIHKLVTQKVITRWYEQVKFFYLLSTWSESKITTIFIS